MIYILISSLVKTILNSKKMFHRFDKVSLNAASYQTADSTVSVCTSKEPELKGLKST